jgi:hypothetical protein
VQTSDQVLANDMGVLDQKELDWVTLITCQGFDENSHSYTYRRVVQAVLVSVDLDD